LLSGKVSHLDPDLADARHAVSIRRILAVVHRNCVALRLFLDDYRDRLLGAIPKDTQLYWFAQGHGRYRTLQFTGVLYRLAGDADKDISILQAGLGRRRSVGHLGNQETGAIRHAKPLGYFRFQGSDLNAEVTAMHGAVLQQLVHDVL